MPSFDVQVSGGSQKVWQDTHSPSRLNPNASHPHTNRALSLPATLTVRAVVGGVVAPLDADAVMAGRTFSAVMSRWSGTFPPVVTQTPGQSSEITVQLQATNVGHQALLVTLSDDGGSLLVPFDGEPVL